MNHIFCIKEKDILNVYKEEGKIKQYNYCKNYIRFMNLKTKKPIKEITNKFCVCYSVLLRWKRKETTPYGIKCLNFLESKNLIPFYPTERIARIIGFLHGDGFLCDSLLSFGFSSNDLQMLKRLKKDTEKELKVKGKIEKKIERGEIVTIHGKESRATKPTYHLEFNSKAVCSLLYKLGVPKGRKIYQEYTVPKWIMTGNKKIKLAFLQGLFDSELSNSPVSTYKGHKDNISNMKMELGKKETLQTNLRYYLEQIKELLRDFNVESKVSNLREYREGRISLTLNISNRLKNLYRFIENIGFYYPKTKKQRSLEIKNLILDKIKKHNKIFEVLDHVKDKQKFTTKDLVLDFSLSRSSSIFIGKYLYKYNLVDRKRRKDKWFDYYPKREKIQNILNNPNSLISLPNMENIWKDE